MKQKGFVNIVLILCLIVILAGAVGYFALRKPAPIAQVSAPTESEILMSLKTNWQSVQALIPFRPAYHNQAENAAKTWRIPPAVQFIGKNNLLARIEDDNNVRVFILNFDGGKFSPLETFQNQGEFTPSDWLNLITKYGATSYSPSTYTKDLVRNGELVSFQNLTKVSENVFLKNYWAVSKNPSPTQPPVIPSLSLPTTCTDQQEGTPVITSLSTYFGPVGTVVEVRGCNLSGFESDLDVVFERSDGAKIPLYGGTSFAAGKLIKVRVGSYCESGFETGRYSGITKACTTITAMPGIYKVYATPWGKKSNEARFTITDETTSIKIYFHNSRLRPSNSCNEVVAAGRVIPRTEKIATAAINELLGGPSSEEKAGDYATDIPAGSKLNSLVIVNGEARADFNEITESGGGSCSMAMRTSQIRETLLQFPTVKTVKLSINGRTEDIFQP